MNLTEVSVRRPVLAWMIMIATVLFGVIALSRIGISQYPDIDYPTLNVSLGWEGAAPGVVEADITEPVEEALIQVEGVRSITSVSRVGESQVTLELELGRDVDVAVQEVQAKIAQITRSLPREIDPPTVQKTNPEDQPILWLALSGPFSRQFLSDFARYSVKERLETVPGVGEVFLGGYLQRNVRVWIDADRLSASGLTIAEVIAALRREHLELPAGRIETPSREITVRVMGEAFDLETLNGLVLRPSEVAPVRLQDVALVEDGFEDVRRMGRVNGQPAQGIGIKKQRGSNAVAVARGVKAAIADLKKTMPAELDLLVNFDATVFIEESVTEVEFEIALAVLLTGLICWLFLGAFSSNLNVNLAIPMSLAGTIATAYFLGYTLNMFTLLALGLAVGIVVDDAIMVMENVFRHGALKKSGASAAIEGTREITFAALSSTIAVIAIFLPVVFMKGIIGKFFLQFGVTLSVAVAFSYLEAITLAPSRLAQFMAKPGAAAQRGRFGRSVDRALFALGRRYASTLGFALTRPVAVLLLATLLFLGSIFGIQQLPRELVPSQDQSRLMVRVQTAVGSSLAETNRLVTRAEAWLLSRPEVLRAFAIVGGFGGSGVNSSIFFLTLAPKDERATTQSEFQAIARKELNGIPGLRAVVQDLSQQGFAAQRGFPVEFSVRGPNWSELIRIADKMKSELVQSGLVVDIDTDYVLGMPEVSIALDRARAADLGVSVDDVATTVNALVGGTRVGKFTTAGRRVDMRVRLLKEQRGRPEDIDALHVRSRSGALVPLSSLITRSEHPALQAITRKDRERAITIFANVAPGHGQDEALKSVETLGRDLPLGYRVVLGGQSAAMRESMASLWFALVLGIVVAYMVLAAQFNSFVHPITVLTILPLSVAGAVAALWVTGRSLNMFSMIGLLLLLGIVKKNSIILVDFAIQLRQREALDATSAMLRAGPTRLRPILMTTLSTMMSALPIAIGAGPGSEVRTPMAIAVLGGLVLSTPLSLYVVPAFYVVAERVVTWIVPRRSPHTEEATQPQGP